MPDKSHDSQQIVRVLETIGLIGGGEIGNNDFADLKLFTAILVAADGGANAIVEKGQVPVAVIGDLDSVSDAAREAIPDDRLHHVSDQNTTDLEKCLALIDATTDPWRWISRGSAGSPAGGLLGDCGTEGAALPVAWSQGHCVSRTLAR